MANEYREHGERITRLEQIMENLIEERKDFEMRLRSLEHTIWKGIGIISFVAFLGPMLAKLLIK